MGCRVLALVLALALAIPAGAQQAGDIEIYVDGVWKCRTRAINLSGQLFSSANICPGATANLNPGASVNLGGTCIGDAPGQPYDICNPFQIQDLEAETGTFSGALSAASAILTGAFQALTGKFTSQVRIGDSGAFTSGVEAEVVGDAVISSTLKVGGTGLASSPFKFHLVGDALINTITGGTANGDGVTIDATSNTANIDNASAVVKVLNFLQVLPAGTTISLGSGLTALAVGIAGETYVFTGSAPSFAAVGIPSGTNFKFDAAPNGIRSVIGNQVLPAISLSAGTASTYGGPRGTYFLPTLTSDETTGLHTVLGAHGLETGVVFGAFGPNGSATGTMTRSAGVVVNGNNVGAAWTLLNLVGMHFNNATISGSVLNQSVIEAEALSGATNNVLVWGKGDNPILINGGLSVGDTQSGSSPTNVPSGTKLYVTNGYAQVMKAGTSTTGGDCNSTTLEYRQFNLDSTSGVDQVCTCFDATWKCHAADGQPVIDIDDTTTDCSWTTQDDTFLCMDSTVSLTGGKTAIIFVTVQEEDSGSAQETTTWRLYRQSGSCGTLNNNNNPSGTELDTGGAGAGHATAPSATASQAIQSTMLFYDTATIAGTSHYCLTAENDTSSQSHTMDFARTVVLEFQ